MVDNDLIHRRLKREMNARIEAESVIEQKSRELYEANVQLTNYSERLKQSNHDLEQFAHVVSHDLKSPLSRLKGFVELLEINCKDGADENKEYLSLMKSQVIKMEELITEILRYSELNADLASLSKVDLNRLIDEIISDLPNSENFNVQIDKELPIIIANPIQIKQIFQNLIGNSIKYHNRETGNINIDWEDLGKFYSLTVSDDGPGISVEYHDKIFELFEKGPSNKKVDSTGIGLAIVKKIINKVGGQVWVNPKFKEGTQICINWPKEMNI